MANLDKSNQCFSSSCFITSSLLLLLNMLAHQSIFLKESNHNLISNKFSNNILLNGLNIQNTLAKPPNSARPIEIRSLTTHQLKRGGKNTLILMLTKGPKPLCHYPPSILFSPFHSTSLMTTISSPFKRSVKLAALQRKRGFLPCCYLLPTF